jgi:hypothetical protein
MQLPWYRIIVSLLRNVNNNIKKNYPEQLMRPDGNKKEDVFVLIVEREFEFNDKGGFP